MDDYLKERDAQRKREYHRKWRAEHKESVRAAQMRYWAKKAAELNKLSAIPEDAEIRDAEEGTKDHD